LSKKEEKKNRIPINEWEKKNDIEKASYGLNFLTEHRNIFLSSNILKM